MKLQTGSSLDFIIYNTNNYNTIIVNSSKELVEKYNEIISEYLDEFFLKITTKTTQMYKYLCNKGIDTISNVFNILFYYTKNLELTYYHSKKAISFYIEFIQQTAVHSDNYLNLTSKDGTLFVYKKTIFEINNNYKKICQFQVIKIEKY